MLVPNCVCYSNDTVMDKFELGEMKKMADQFTGYATNAKLLPNPSLLSISQALFRNNGYCQTAALV